MRCAVAIALDRSSQGALAFARWIAGGGSVWRKRDAPVTIVALHVLEEAEHAFTPDLEADIRPLVEQQLEGAGLRDRVEGPYLAYGPSAHAILAEEVRARAIDLVVLGRRANAEDEDLVRLGPTARRFLRQLVAPTVIVPPSLGIADFGAGPIVCAIDLLEPCPATLAHARQLAAFLERELVVAHALPQIEDELDFTLHPEPVAGLLRTLANTHPAVLEAHAAWCASHEAQGLRTVFVTGRTHRRMLDLIEHTRPAIVVCPSHRPGIIERMFNPNLASTLAGYASAAVMIVGEA